MRLGCRGGQTDGGLGHRQPSMIGAVLSKRGVTPPVNTVTCIMTCAPKSLRVTEHDYAVNRSDTPTCGAFSASPLTPSDLGVDQPHSGFVREHESPRSAGK